MDLKVLRGQRIQNQLDEDSTYNQLYTGIVQGFPGTQKRQNATGSVIVRRVSYVPYINDSVLRVESIVNSGPNKYEPVIMFRGVEFKDTAVGNAVTIRAADGQEYNITPISLAGSRLKVRCGCLDFYHRFSTQNFADGSLEGNPPPPYQDRDPNRGPANPTQTPGVCKHLIKLVQEMKKSGIVT
jgi:hypothetical protein